MNTSSRSWGWKLASATLSTMGGALARVVVLSPIALFGNCTLAQNITLDGSLGPAGTLTGPNYVIPQAVGQTVDSNLFHSFRQFSLDIGESAVFQSAANIRNILSRVTGGSPSLIDGLIKTQSSSVNLFLINPSGIVFGPNASINVGGVTRGSFVATTIDALVWPNGRQFSATNSGGANSLLTIVGDPSGFISSLRPPKPITSSGSTLSVYEGQSLLLLGGDVTLGGSRLFNGGRIELGGVAGAGQVGLNVDGNNLRLSFPEDLTRADVSITDGTGIYVVAENGGSVGINARNLDISGDSNVLAAINREGLGSVGSQAGDIEINTTGAVTVAKSEIRNTVRSRAVGNSGNINITAASLSVTDGAQLIASPFGQQGNAGNVNINARDMVSFEGSGSAAFSNVAKGAVGNSGNINITAASLSVTDGARLVASTFGQQGDAGNVNINARDMVSFEGSGSATFSNVAKGAVGNSGNINITAASLSVTDGAQLNASTFGQQGNAGSVNINARDMASFEGSGSVAFSSVANGAVGDGGDINITTGSLLMTDGAQLVADTFGQGNAGSVNINALDSVSFDGVGSDGSNTGVFSTVGGIGNGGEINITARSLLVTNGAILLGSTKLRGQGDAGSVNINVRDSVSFDGVGSDGFPSAALSAVEFEGVGNGGDINITAGSLSVTNGAYLSASTLGQGDAGSVNINARDSVSFDGVSSDGLSSGAFSTVEDTAVGNGEGINITTGSLSLTDGAYLSASTRGQGNGGNITLNVNSLEAVNGGQVLTTSRSNGKAGNITVNAADSVTLSGSDPNYLARLQSSEKVRVFEVFGRKVAIREQAAAGAGPASGLFVSSEGTGNAGNLEVTSRELWLFNRAVLRATTSSGEGGNIKLRSQDLILMRRNSEISTAAGGTGNGGNIEIIDADLIVAVPSEDSDIVANAFEGNGGNITITTQGIFGIEFQQQRTSQSDITASSEFGVNGVVEINTPDVDPSRGLVNLPGQPTDTEVAQTCQPGGSQDQSAFIVTGRGGLPPNPTEALSSDAIQVDWVTLNPGLENRSSPPQATNPTAPEPAPIVEAQGWVIGDNGEVILTASAVPVLPHSSWRTPAECRATQSVPGH